MATMGRVAETGSSAVGSNPVTDPVGLSRYHSSANTVLCAGILTGLLLGSIGWLSPGVGFFVGAVPTFFLAALSHTLCDERSSTP